jgi:type I restriction enzyme S subunit
MATGQVIASSIEGSLDRCALVTPEYDKALCSTGFHRFSSQDINPETMLLLFKSWPIQQLMKRGCSGTILCGILPTALEHVDLPMVNPQVQKELAAKVRESFALRAESKRLLDLAKHAVETAIEQGESKAMEALRVWFG